MATAASRMIGIPQRIMAIHAGLKGRGKSRRLMMSAPPDMASSTISFLMPPASRNDSIIVIALFI